MLLPTFQFGITTICQTEAGQEKENAYAECGKQLTSLLHLETNAIGI